MQIMNFLKDYERNELKKLLNNLQKSSLKRKSKDQLNVLGDLFSKMMHYATAHADASLFSKIEHLSRKCHLAVNNEQEEENGSF